MIQIIIDENGSGKLRMSAEALELLTDEEIAYLREIGRKLKERRD